ncbi:MAG TPA: hypothetical protein PKA08_06110 [Elusimicrobiota bacterium]|nr:hypothetical protein [Elusimicrobiota bacterium]
MTRRLLPALLLAAWSAQAADTSDNARLKLPWDTIKSVLKIDRNDVRLTAVEFETLLKLTSAKPLPDYRLMEGDVVLPRAEFTRLVQSLVPPAPEAAGAYLPKAVYRGRLENHAVRFAAALQLEIPRRPTRPLSVDVFPGGVAFEEILLDGKPARTDLSTGRLTLVATEAGSHRVDLKYVVPLPDASAAQSFTVPVARTPITDWTLEIPENNLDIAVSPALHRDVSGAAGATRVRALLPPTDTVSATWNPLAPDAAKGPAQVYATVDHLLSVEEDALRLTGIVDLEVLHNTINRATLEIPEGFAVLNVRGEDLAEWQENAGRPATLDVPFRSARKGRVAFEVDLERVIPGEKSTTTVAGLTVRGALRQRGFVGLELKSDAELPPPDTQGLDPQDPFRELPALLTARSARLLFGYRYLRPPFQIRLALSRHETVAVVSSVIDRAEGTTVLREDGKRVHQVVYYLRQAAKQFLSIRLPEGARLWNAFVDGAPVKPVMGSSGTVLLPLIRAGRNPADEFPVEFVYFEKTTPLGFLGRETVHFPTPDVMVSRLRWTVVTPPDQGFHSFGHDFEPEIAAPAAPAFLAANGVTRAFAAPDEPMIEESEGALKDRDGFDDKERLDQLSAAKPMAKKIQTFRAEMNAPAPSVGGEWQGKGGGAKTDVSAVRGVMPVRVSVPRVGVQRVFAKTLPESNALLPLVFYHGTAGAGWLLKLFLVLGALGLMWIFRTPLGRGALWVRPRVEPWARRVPWTDPALGAFGAGVLSLGAAALSRGLFYISLIPFTWAVGRWILSALPRGDHR